MSAGTRRSVLFGVAAVLLSFGAPATAQQSGQLRVTVRYTGQGAVDATHELFVWAFDTPQITNDTVAVATASITSNGGTAALTGLPARVYIAAAYDEKGEYDGTSGPPPAGTPVVIYGEGGQAKPVPSGGPEASVVVTFDATHRAR